MAASKAIVLGLAGHDGATVAWCREDSTDLCGQGSFSGTPELVDQVMGILVRREPIDLPTMVQWTFLPDPQLRPEDVAAAMITAIEVDSDISGLLAQFPELAQP